MTEIESPGWSIAFLLVQADEKLGEPLFHVPHFATALHTETRWSAELKENAALQKQVADVQTQIAAMRRDGRCKTSLGVPL